MYPYYGADDCMLLLWFDEIKPFYFQTNSIARRVLAGEKGTLLAIHS